MRECLKLNCIGERNTRGRLKKKRKEKKEV